MLPPHSFQHLIISAKKNALLIYLHVRPLCSGKDPLHHLGRVVPQGDFPTGGPTPQGDILSRTLSALTGRWLLLRGLLRLGLIAVMQTHPGCGRLFRDDRVAVVQGYCGQFRRRSDLWRLHGAGSLTVALTLHGRHAVSERRGCKALAKWGACTLPRNICGLLCSFAAP